MKKKTTQKIVSVNDELGITNTYHIECQHQFFKLADEVKTKEENMTRITIRRGIRVMCALCGQQRNLWIDGEVEIL